MTQTITLQLSETVMERAKQVAAALEYSVEDVLEATLSASLPDLSNVPVDVQGDLARMAALDDMALWDITQKMLSEDQEQRWQQLRDVRVERELNPVETAELEALHREYGRITLQKARAFALLSSRNGRPLLQNLP